MSATRVQFDTLAGVGSVSFAPLTEWQQRRLYVTLGGGLTAFEGGQWAAQVNGNMSLLSGRIGGSPFRAELVGTGLGTYHSSQYRTGSGRGEARLHASGRHLGVWAGAAGAVGGGSADTALTTGLGPTFGLWGRYGSANAVVTLHALRIEGWWFPEVNGRISTSVGPIDVLAYAGWRRGTEASGLVASSWGGASGAVWLTGNVALVLSGGSYPIDLFQGLPAGRYLAAGIRLASRRPAVFSIKPVGRPVYTRSDGEGLVSFAVPGAVRVEIVGDWNGWQRLPMERRRDERWAVRLELAPGVYRFNLIVDGDRWIVPDGVAGLDDGFGGRSGILIVPE